MPQANTNFKPNFVQNAQHCSLVTNSSAIMESIDSPSLTLLNNKAHMSSQQTNFKNTPGIPVENEFTSLKLENEEDSDASSFLLMDGQEHMKINSVDMFLKLLQCPKNEKVKVISIFGNTGDGKSHTMNHVFFDGVEIFKTSEEQHSCTLGVWAAYDSVNRVLCLDTEGLLGITKQENQRTRMLLKVLAISDIVIYRTRSERLHRDMYTFLGGASQAFSRHFMGALRALGLQQPPSALGPAVIIFHETRNTKILNSTVSASPEDILRSEFSNMHYDLEAFSSLRYVGQHTAVPPTRYESLKSAVQAEIINTTVRSPRPAAVVLQTLKALNNKFSGTLSEKPTSVFPEQYFTCGTTCLSCGERCARSMGHEQQGESHQNTKKCRFQHQYGNKVFICKTCHMAGNEVIVTPRYQSSDTAQSSSGPLAAGSWVAGLVSYAWSGSVIDCPNCGEIYRSRQYWYGNRNPEDTAVRSEIVHVWPGNKLLPRSGPPHSAQKVLDGVTYISDVVANVATVPSRALSDWMTDKLAPTYWKPNALIKHCHSCRIKFDNSSEATLSKHHCRACGEGFCAGCSKWRMPVPWRDWGTDPVRVCEDCYRQSSKHSDQKNSVPGEEAGVLTRKYGEVVVNTLSSVAAALEYPKDLIKEAARPSYWVPDSEAPSCHLCGVLFNSDSECNSTTSSINTELNSTGPMMAATSDQQRTILVYQRRHHCRSCGQAVCDKCSLRRRPVPERDWYEPKRVCDACYNRKSE